MTDFDETYDESIVLTDSYSRIWVTSKSITDATSLTDIFSYDWVLSRTYTEVLSLSDGDGYVTKAISPNGGYIALYAEEATLSAALNELITSLEKEGCPSTQTKIALANDGTNYAAVAIVKRH